MTGLGCAVWGLGSSFRRFFTVLTGLILTLFLAMQAALAQGVADDSVKRGQPHRGGTLRVTMASPSETLDPQITYSSAYLQIFVSVYDGLLAYRRASSKEGLEIVPDIAEALPTVSPDGLTWRFRIHDHIFFSNGAALTTDDVVASMRRLFRVGSPTADSFYRNIMGAEKCLQHAAQCRLEGVTGDVKSRVVTFRLRQPDPEFAQKLAFSHAVILPRDVTGRDSGASPLPGTGPYHITKYDPSTGMRLERNPFFRPWSPLAQPDGYVDHIQIDFGLTDEAAVTAVERGQYDVMLGEKPQDRYSELGDRYARQIHLQPLLGYYYLVLNVREPPFTSIKVRQALNQAIDRRAVAILYGGEAVATPLCDLIPDGMRKRPSDCAARAHQRPDLAKARRVIRETPFAGAAVTLVVRNNAVDTNIGLYVRDLLEKLSFKASIRTLAPASLSSYIGNSDHHVAIALTTWYADYPSPSVFLYDLLGCENIHPGLDISTNASGYCEPVLERLMKQAMTTQDKAEAAQFWEEANVMAMRAAPLIPLIQPRYIDFTSARLGHYRYSLLNHLILSEVWVR
ncbi:4-phytase [Acetobacteraceae bacterium EV16G]|uniref:4-phytase n=1 Tax=Sorlinia euscelidii TaxID=3081148 RepID=A0ABU7U3X7_9PROT